MSDSRFDELFTPERYKKNEIEGREFFFADGSDLLANQQYKITITHVPSNTSIDFKAFITVFNDTYSQDWASEPVYGRADPIYAFKTTTRRISIGFKMPAVNESEAYENLTKAQRLAQFMYPNYTDLGGVKTVSQGPLLRLKVMNLLQSTNGISQDTGEQTENQIYSSYQNSGQGMLGFCNDITFNFNLENPDNGVFQKSETGHNGTILPKLIEVTIGGFSPIHEHHLGWNENNKFGVDIDNPDGASFPYGANIPSPPDESEGSSYSELEEQENERRQAEAAIANAQARYGGLFGDLRARRDARRLADGSISNESKAQYIASALTGYFTSPFSEYASQEQDSADQGAVSEYDYVGED